VTFIWVFEKPYGIPQISSENILILQKESVFDEDIDENMFPV
jgi:hypothetical protein